MDKNIEKLLFGETTNNKDAGADNIQTIDQQACALIKQTMDVYNCQCIPASIGSDYALDIALTSVTIILGIVCAVTSRGYLPVVALMVVTTYMALSWLDMRFKSHCAKTWGIHGPTDTSRKTWAMGFIKDPSQQWKVDTTTGGLGTHCCWWMWKRDMNHTTKKEFEALFPVPEFDALSKDEQVRLVAIKTVYEGLYREYVFSAAQ